MDSYDPNSTQRMAGRWSATAAAIALLFGCGTGMVPQSTVDSTSPRALRWTASPHGVPSLTGILQMNGTALVETPGGTFLYSVGGNTGPVGLDTNTLWYAPVRGASLGPWKQTDATLGDAGVVYHTRSTVGFNGRLYVVGGRFHDGDGFEAGFDGIRVFEPDATGNIPADRIVSYFGQGDGARIPDVNPPLDTLESAAVVVPSRRRPGDGILHILGGSGTQAVRSVRLDARTGAILGGGPKGELATALVESPPLPKAIAFAPAVAHGNFVYVVGAHPVSAEVLYAPIHDDDTLGAWRSTTAPLPEERFDGGAVSFGGALYYFGGTTKDNNTTRDTVFRAVPQTDGDILAWDTDTPIPVAPGLRRIAANATRDAVFLVGGRLTTNVFVEAEGEKRIADTVFSPDTWIATPSRR